MLVIIIIGAINIAVLSIVLGLSSNLKRYILDHLHRFKQEICDNLNKQQLQNSKLIQDALRENLSHHAETLTKQFNNLTQTADQKLQQISNQVEVRLNQGFEKTTETFTNIVKRLSIIDNAQQRLIELSQNVVSLQQILADKRSRGAFGEVQLKNLIENLIPKENVAFQHQLNNGKIVDCMLFLPEPTGNLAIDAKFPLENFQKLVNFDTSNNEKQQAKNQFRQDIKKHIADISSKYIHPGETANGAILFIPAEAVFAEIHSEFPELVELAHKNNVWLASPTTMMAIVTTASAVLKDNATREHVHVIQEHLRQLAKDFSRFDERMLKLSKHISQANEDVKQVQTTAKKISSRFSKVEKVELNASSEIII